MKAAVNSGNVFTLEISTIINIFVIDDWAPTMCHCHSGAIVGALPSRDL